MNKTHIWKTLLQQNPASSFIFKALSGTMVLNIFAVGLSFLLQLLLARTMGAEQLGWFMQGMAWIAILSILCLCGFSVSVIRICGEYDANQDDALMHGILKRSVEIVLGVSALISLCAIAVLAVVYEPFSLPFNTLALSFAILPVWCLMILRQGMLRAFKLVVKAKIPENLIRPGGAIILCGALYFVQNASLQADQAMLMNAIAVCAAVVFSQKWFAQVKPHAVFDITPEYRTKEWLKISLPMTLTTWVPILLRRTDILMVGYFMGAHATGIYSVAVAVSSVMQMIYGSVVNVMAPMYAEGHFKGDYNSLKKNYVLALVSVAGPTLIGTLFLLIAGPYIIDLFGESFENGYSAFAILLIGQLLGALFGTPESFMGMTGREKTLAHWLLGGAAFNFMLNIPLILLYGIEGAALATAITTVLLKIVLSVHVWKAFKQQA